MSNNDEFNEVGFYNHEGNEFLTVDGKSINTMISSVVADVTDYLISLGVQQSKIHNFK